MNLNTFKPYLVVALLALASAPSFAQTALLSYVSEPGDYIGLGQTLSLSGPENISSQASTEQNSLGVHVNTSLHNLHLGLTAPAGQRLVVRRYEGAVNNPSASQPGLTFYGDGRGCNNSYGRFEILEASYGPNGVIETLHATWEQHCEGAVPALFGEVYISNPPQPTPLAITIAFNPVAEFKPSTKQVTVTGTLSCSTQATGPAKFSIQVSQTFNGNNRFAYASSSLEIPCSQATQNWSVTLKSAGTNKFRAQNAQVTLGAYATDPSNGIPVRTDVDGVVTLTAK